jgi:hypothetical protein
MRPSRQIRSFLPPNDGRVGGGCPVDGVRCLRELLRTGCELVRCHTRVMAPLLAGPDEHVTMLDVGVHWEPGAPEAVLITGDDGAVLVLNAHTVDADQRCVVLRWKRATAVALEPPNDEAISGHRLYDRGLREVSWAGEVHHSAWIADLERRNRVHPYHDAQRYAGRRHYIFRLKENVAEVISAHPLEVLRLPGSTLQAAYAALAR